MNETLPQIYVVSSMMFYRQSAELYIGADVAFKNRPDALNYIYGAAEEHVNDSDVISDNDKPELKKLLQYVKHRDIDELQMNMSSKEDGEIFVSKDNKETFTLTIHAESSSYEFSWRIDEVRLR